MSGRIDLRSLPRIQDGWSFLYIEHARVERENHSIVFVDESGETPVPVASLSVLMLGPGTSITHAAVTSLADNGCSIVWCGEKGVRFYASGLGETRRSANLLSQAAAWADVAKRTAVVRRMYGLRFGTDLDDSYSIEQARGKEGARVRDAYANASRVSGVPWNGRRYDGDWSSTDPLNRALSSANACLYGVCHAAIVAAGFTPGIGFVHTGRALAFVYDVADLYKVETTVPLAFRAAAEHRNAKDFDSIVRRLCREALHEARLLDRIVPDILRVIGARGEDERAEEERVRLWGPDGDVDGAQNFAESEEDGPLQ
jgi:CRISP-associated protein Cas1